MMYVDTSQGMKRMVSRMPMPDDTDPPGTDGSITAKRRQILRQLSIAHHAVDEGKDRPLVSTHEFPISSLVSLTSPLDHLLIGGR